tara:strand:+ start:639 stop:3161 length:2523 start_codon:yes stop_codon:yes gene_type:complete
MNDEKLLDEQLDLEEAMADKGAERVRSATLKANNSGASMRTASAKGLSATLGPLLVAALDKKRAEAKAARGTSPSWVRLTAALSTHMLAAATITAVVDSITLEMRMTATAAKLGEVLNTEMRLNSADRPTRQAVKNVLKARNKVGASAGWKKRVAIHVTAKRSSMAATWTQAERVQVGAALIHALAKSTGAISIVLAPNADVLHKAYNPKKTSYTIIANPELLAACAARDENVAADALALLPMIMQPLDWVSTTSGGYLNTELPLVMNVSKEWLSNDKLTAESMPAVYAAMNAVQRTGYRVNVQVLEVFEQLWSAGGLAAGLPRNGPIEVAAFRAPVNTSQSDISNSEDLARWKREAQRQHQENALATNDTLKVLRTRSVASQFAGRPIWFPVQADSRGRMYPVSTFLSPQGPDLERALLVFATAEPLVTQEAADWLAIHGANSFGVKGTLAERVEWVDANHDAIMSVAQDPLGKAKGFWTTSDKPFSFLAWCFDWFGYQTAEGDGMEYKSAIPVAMDGTTNGLQHYAAINLNSEGAENCNLTGNLDEPPADVYITVLDATIKRLKTIKDGGGEDAAAATVLLTLPLDRKLTKRPVMTRVYGSTRYGCGLMVEEWFVEMLKTGVDMPWINVRDGDAAKHVRLLATAVWDAIDDTVASAKVTMDWLRNTTAQLADSNLPLVWETKDGWPVEMRYLKTTSKRIRSVVGSVDMRFTVNQDVIPQKIDKKRQSNCSAPNFIHSQDAAALRGYVNMMQLEPTETEVQFSMIHDSFATHARYSALAAVKIRQAFVDLYTGDCVIDEMHRAAENAIGATVYRVKLPAAPAKGTFEISEVLSSPYFFH